MTIIEEGYGSVARLVASAAEIAQKGGEVIDAFEIAGIFYLRYKNAVVEKVVEKTVVETKVVQVETAEKQQKPRKGK